MELCPSFNAFYLVKSSLFIGTESFRQHSLFLLGAHSILFIN